MAFGNLGTIWCELGVDLKKLDAGIASAKLKLAEANTTVSSFGAKLTAQSTRLLAVGGAMAGAVAGVGIASIKMAKDFEVSMRNVNSIAKVSEEEFAKMSEEVITLSTKLPQSAKVLADGLYDISSSGFQGADGLAVLEASAKAASAGMTNTATSAKGITAVLNAYGLEATDAAKVSDTMFKTVDKGVISFEELSSNIGDVVGTANLADIEFNELSGALAYMTTKGIGAAEATTALNRLILSIIDPSEELAVVLHNAGYESGEMALQQLGLVGVMELMQEASGGSLTELQKLTPEMRAMKAAGALLGGGIEELNAYMLEFKDTTGATDAALKEQSKSLEYNIQILKNNIGAIGISLGTELIPPITDTVTKITEWISKNQELAGNIVKIGGGIVGFAGIVTMLAGVIGKLRGAMIALNTATSGWATVIIPLAIAAAYLGKKAYDSYKWSMEETEKKIYDLATAEKTLYDARKHYISAEWWETEDIERQAEAIELDEKRAEAIQKMVNLYPSLESRVVEVARAYEDANDAIKSTPWNATEEQINANVMALDNAKIAYKNLGDELIQLEEDLKTDAIDSHTEAIIRADEAIQKYSRAFPEAISEIEYLNTQLEIGTISQENYDQRIGEITGDMKRYVEITKILNQETKDNWVYTTNLTGEQKELAKKLGITEEVMEDLGIKIDETTGLIEEQANEVDKLRKEFSDLIDEIFGHITTYNDFEEANWAVEDAQKALTEAIKEFGEGSREAEEAQNRLDDANVEAIKTAFELSTSIKATTEQQEEARKKAVELGFQYIKTGDIGVEEFWEMATEFGLASADIIKLAEEMGLELDEATRKRIAEIDADTTKVDEAVKHTNEELAKIKDKTVTITVKQNIGKLGWEGIDEELYKKMFKPATGGIITASGLKMAGGGLIGYDTPMLKAASGYTIPQTGREVPIIAHEGEVILNTSQQKNLAEAIWGVANGKGQGGSVVNNFNISELVVREEADIDRIAYKLYDLQQTKNMGIGVR